MSFWWIRLGGGEKLFVCSYDLFRTLLWLTLVRANGNPKLKVMKIASFQKPAKNSTLLAIFIHSKRMKLVTQSAYLIAQCQDGGPVLCHGWHTHICILMAPSSCMCWAELLVWVSLPTICCLSMNITALKKERRHCQNSPVEGLQLHHFLSGWLMFVSV